MKPKICITSHSDVLPIESLWTITSLWDKADNMFLIVWVQQESEGLGRGRGEREKEWNKFMKESERDK